MKPRFSAISNDNLLLWQTKSHCCPISFSDYKKNKNKYIIKTYLPNVPFLNISILCEGQCVLEAFNGSNYFLSWIWRPIPRISYNPCCWHSFQSVLFDEFNDSPCHSSSITFLIWKNDKNIYRNGRVKKLRVICFCEKVHENIIL